MCYICDIANSDCVAEMFGAKLMGGPDSVFGLVRLWARRSGGRIPVGTRDVL
jgi:hypothetical protein